VSGAAKVEIVGRGTWLDMVALRLLQREEKLGRNVDVLRTESGLGASGIPHIGSLGDVIRAYGIKLALETQGRRSEFIAFSDDMDGLRKVPEGMPESLKKYLGHPVSAIPDPYNCHESYAAHMNSLLREGMDKCGVQYTFHSATEDYRNGLLTGQVRKILAAADRVGKIVKEEVGQEKYMQVLPYFPICESCGRIYTTRAVSFESETNKVVYSCEGSRQEIRGQALEGCGYKGEVDITKGRGKLPWKGDFAARWAALGITFEAYGKDIADSVRVNDRICEEILGYPPPFHVRYELFLGKAGKKISKSASVQILTPQTWFKYATPQSLNLLMFKRIAGARSVSVEDIPAYTDELSRLGEVYFNKSTVEDEKERAKLRGLFEYAHFLKPPSSPRPHVPYNLLVYLVTVAPPDKVNEYVGQKLKEYGYFKEGLPPEIREEIAYALNWSRDFKEISEAKIELTNSQRFAIEDLVSVVRSEADERRLQNSIFGIAQKYSLEPAEFFRLLYQILLGAPRGPRLGPYIKAMGNEQVARALERATGKT